MQLGRAAIRKDQDQPATHMSWNGTTEDALPPRGFEKKKKRCGLTGSVKSSIHTFSYLIRSQSPGGPL